MDDDLHKRIDELVSEEHRLRRSHDDGSALTPEERTRMDALERELDRAWDLLRQRDARRAAGKNPDEATMRSATVVEGYLS